MGRLTCLPLVPVNQFQLYTCDVPPSRPWLGIRTHPGMVWLLCRVLHQKGRDLTASLACFRTREMHLHSHLPVPRLPFKEHLGQPPKAPPPPSLWALYQGQPIPPALASCPNNWHGQTQQASEPWARSLQDATTLLEEVRGPSKVNLQLRGTTPGHKPPEAFCHLPELLRAREAWRKVPIGLNPRA